MAANFNSFHLQRQRTFTGRPQLTYQFDVKSANVVTFYQCTPRLRAGLDQQYFVGDRSHFYD